MDLTPNPLLRTTTPGRLQGNRAEVKASRKEFKRLERTRTAIEQIGQLPDEGKELILIMDGSFHGWDLIEAAISLISPETIKSLNIATLGFNNTQTERLSSLIDEGTVKSFSMIVSEMFREKNKSEFAFLFESMAERGAKVASTRNHAKLILIETTSGRLFSFHGSLNLRRCHAYEQIAISSDPDVHHFFMEYIREVMA